MGTDAAQIMRSDLGSGKPLLHYQETPVFISDFVSSVEPVYKLHSTALTIASTTATSVTLDQDVKAELEAEIGVVSASNPAYLVARTGATGKWSKVVLKVTAITDDGATTTLTIDPSFAITDDEKNKPQTLQNSLLALNVATGLVGRSAEVYERVDGTSIYAGKFGEGEGICGFTLDMSQAIQIKYVGPSREFDQEQYRMKFYCGFESYSRLAVARLKSVLPL